MSDEKKTTQLTGAFYLGERRLDTSHAETMEYVRSRFAAKPAQPVEAVDLPHMSLSQLRSSHADSQYGARADANEHAFHGLAVALLDRAIAALAHPRPTGDVMVSVVSEDANNYCRILTALGMEEEGDPVAEVERLIAAAYDQGVADAGVAATTAPTGEQAGEVDRTAPERIYLQVDGDGDNADRDEAFPNFADYEVTWCAQSQGGLEVEYVRADLAQPRPTGVPDGLADDAARWRFVRELAWFVDAARHVYDVKDTKGPFASWHSWPSPDWDEIQGEIDKVRLAAAPAPGKGGEA